MTIMMYGFWYIKHDRQDFLSFWAIFCPFTPLTIQKIKILKKWKKLLEILSFTQVYHKWQSYDMVPEISTATDRFLCHLWPFFAFIPPKNPKNKSFTKLKKAPGDIIILDKCTKNHDHRLYCSWAIVCAGCNYYFSFCTIFYPSLPPPSDSPKNGKKNTWRYHHFTLVCQKSWS